MSNPHLNGTKLLLRGLGIRQEDLAQVAGVSRFTVTKYLNGSARWQPGDAIRRIERAVDLLSRLDRKALLEPGGRRALLVEIAHQIAELSLGEPEATQGTRDPSGGSRSSGPVTERRTVLVAEDERGLRELLEAILSRAGYEVLSAADGLEGLEIVGRHEGPLHLVVSDVQMPRLEGPQMVDELRSSRPRIPVLFVSGTFKAQALDAVEDPRTLCLPKPFTAGELLAKVQELLEHS